LLVAEPATTEVGAEGAASLLKTPDLAKEPKAPKELNDIIINKDIFIVSNKQIVKIHINPYLYFTYLTC
jgi:hypothetical protein